MRSSKLVGSTQHLVDTKHMDDQPGPYCMSFGYDQEPLIRSIKRVGLINHPLLIAEQDGKLDIVMGFRRIHALKALNWEKIPCRIVSPSELSHKECLLLNLHENLSFRKFNEIEKAMILNRLSSVIQRHEILKDYMPILDLSPQGSTLDFYLRIEKELNQEAKNMIVKGHLSLQAAKLILEMDDEARSQITGFMKKLKFNFNQQKQLIEYMLDISHKYKKSIAGILEKEPVKKICSDARMNNPQKVNSVLKVLRTIRFPQLAEAEEKFKKNVSRLDLPDGIKINYPPFFEAPNYRMELVFKDGKDLQEKLNQLILKKGLWKLHDPWEKDF